MPYYVYKIMPSIGGLVKNLECINEFEGFKDAKNFAREQRSEQDTENGISYKVMFADNKLDAEEKLQEHREAPILREWEK